MTDTEAGARQALDSHEAFERTNERYRVTTTVFEATVAVDTTSEMPKYTVTVDVPTLDGAAEDDVGPTVSIDWFETLDRRLQNAPKATLVEVELDEYHLTKDDDTVTVEYVFSQERPQTAADVAKTFVEYVEGTYAEGIIPGYEYRSPVDNLLSSASQGGDGGTPL